MTKMEELAVSLSEALQDANLTPLKRRSLEGRLVQCQEEIAKRKDKRDV